MPHFAHPQNLLWLLVTLVCGLLMAYRERVKRGVLTRFLASPMLARLAAEHSPTLANLKLGLLLGSLACFSVALAGPLWGVRYVHVERQGTDVMFAVDLSESMHAEDYKPSRLAVAQRELGDLMHRLEGNRLGLVGFAGQAFVFCPLTLDASATRLYLDQMDTNSIPMPGTAIGEAIRTALEAFPKGDAGGKAIILLSDGEDHHSDPEGAAREAANLGVKIYTVGIGSVQGEPIPERDGNGKVDGFVRDANGKIVLSRLGEGTLRELAHLSGGLYCHLKPGATNALDAIVGAIEGLQKIRLEENLQNRYIERYQMFVALGLCLLLVERLLRTRRRTLR